MSRQDRLKEYAKPLRAANWQGAGRDQANIDRWSARAAENSKIAPRATDGPMKLPSTKVNQRDTSMKPYQPRTNYGTDAMETNIEGDSVYLRGIRRTT